MFFYHCFVPSLMFGAAAAVYGANPRPGSFTAGVGHTNDRHGINENLLGFLFFLTKVFFFPRICCFNYIQFRIYTRYNNNLTHSNICYYFYHHYSVFASFPYGFFYYKYYSSFDDGGEGRHVQNYALIRINYHAIR